MRILRAHMGTTGCIVLLKVLMRVDVWEMFYANVCWCSVIFRIVCLGTCHNLLACKTMCYNGHCVPSELYILVCR